MICPNCGLNNDELTTRCALCNLDLTMLNEKDKYRFNDDREANNLLTSVSNPVSEEINTDNNSNQDETVKISDNVVVSEPFDTINDQIVVESTETIHTTESKSETVTDTESVVQAKPRKHRKIYISVFALLGVLSVVIYFIANSKTFDVADYSHSVTLNPASDNTIEVITEPSIVESTQHVKENVQEIYYGYDFAGFNAGKLKEIMGDYIISDGSNDYEGPCLILTSAAYPEYKCIFEYNSDKTINDSDFPKCIDIKYGGYLVENIYAGMRISQLYEVNKNIYFGYNAMNGELAFTFKIDNDTNINLKCKNTENVLEGVYHGNPNFNMELINQNVLDYLEEQDAYINTITVQKISQDLLSENESAVEGENLVYNEYNVADFSNYKNEGTFVEYKKMSILHAVEETPIYSEPDVSSKVIATIPYQMTIDGCGEINGFYYIKMNNCAGYVKHEKVEGTAGYFSSSFPPVEEYELKGEGIINTNSGPLNMRSGAGTDFDIICEIPKGRNVLVYSTENPDWYYVVYNFNKGFASAEYIKFID